MTDGPVDIRRKLPPDVRKPWRQKLSEAYAKHIDELPTMQHDIRAMRERLGELKHAISGDDRTTNVEEHVPGVIVLLRCAEDQRAYTCPAEEYMGKSAREYWS